MNDDGTFTKQFTESKASEVCKDLSKYNTNKYTEVYLFVIVN